MIGRGGVPRCGATALYPRRSFEGIAVATSRISNDGDGTVPPQPTHSSLHFIIVLDTWRLRG